MARDVIPIVAQVNGKVRGKFKVTPDLPEDALRDIILKDEGVRRHIDGKPIRKFIVIPNKLVSIVV